MKFIYLIFCIATAMISYTIGNSIFWAILSFIFTPVAWVYLLLTHEVTLSVIKETFGWFFK